MIDDDDSIKGKADYVLRRYLVRCFGAAARQYPEIADMSPEAGADHLMKLRHEKRIRIELDTIDNIVECRIVRAS